MNSAKPGRPRLSERHRAQLTGLVRKDIVDAAIAEFGERGYHDTSIANIAQRLGSGPSTIYNYFTSKREILEQSVDNTIESLVSQIGTFATDPPRTVDEFAKEASRLGDAVADIFANDPGHARMLLIISTSSDPDLRARWTSLFGVLKGFVEQFLVAGVEAGLLRADLDTTSTAAAIISIPFGILATEPTREPNQESDYGLVRATVAMVIAGIRT